MTNPLSAAAQAILIAEAKSRCLREERTCCHPGDPDWNGCHVCVHRRGLAAALRALAVRIKADTADAIRQDVLDIADELDGASR